MLQARWRWRTRRLLQRCRVEADARVLRHAADDREADAASRGVARVGRSDIALSRDRELPERFARLEVHVEHHDGGPIGVVVVVEASIHVLGPLLDERVDDVPLETLARATQRRRDVRAPDRSVFDRRDQPFATELEHGLRPGTVDGDPLGDVEHVVVVERGLCSPRGHVEQAVRAHEPTEVIRIPGVPAVHARCFALHLHLHEPVANRDRRGGDRAHEGRFRGRQGDRGRGRIRSGEQSLAPAHEDELADRRQGHRPCDWIGCPARVGRWICRRIVCAIG